MAAPKNYRHNVEVLVGDCFEIETPGGEASALSNKRNKPQTRTNGNIKDRDCGYQPMDDFRTASRTIRNSKELGPLGRDDEAGALNLITPELRAVAAE